MTRADARERIAAIVQDRLAVDVPGADTDLAESGLIDSLALVTLIVALEDVFGVRMVEFDVEDFRSVDAMVDFLAREGVVS